MRITTLNRHEMLYKNNLKPEVQLWEDGLRTDPNARGPFEWWYFDAKFDDGSSAVVVYYTKAPGQQYGSLVPGIQLTITYPQDGKPQDIFVYENYGADQFKASTEKCDVTIAHNHAQGDLQRYEIYASIGDSSVSLVFESTVPPWRPDINYQYMNQRLTTYFGWLPVVPSAKVSGTLTYNGAAHTVSGVGYHDHNWGNCNLLFDYAYWTWGRVTIGDYTVIFTEMTTRRWFGSQKIPVLMLAKGSQIIVTDGYPLKMVASNWVTDPVSKRQYATLLQFAWERDGESIRFELSDPQILQETSYLYTLPKWLQKIIQIFYNPYYFRFEARMTLHINHQGLNELTAGDAIYEYMLLT